MRFHDARRRRPRGGFEQAASSGFSTPRNASAIATSALSPVTLRIAVPGAARVADLAAVRDERPRRARKERQRLGKAARVESDQSIRAAPARLQSIGEYAAERAVARMPDAMSRHRAPQDEANVQDHVPEPRVHVIARIDVSRSAPAPGRSRARRRARRRRARRSPSTSTSIATGIGGNGAAALSAATARANARAARAPGRSARRRALPADTRCRRAPRRAAAVDGRAAAKLREQAIADPSSECASRGRTARRRPVPRALQEARWRDGARQQIATRVAIEREKLIERHRIASSSPAEASREPKNGACASTMTGTSRTSSSSASSASSVAARTMRAPRLRIAIATRRRRAYRSFAWTGTSRVERCPPRTAAEGAATISRACARLRHRRRSPRSRSRSARQAASLGRSGALSRTLRPTYDTWNTSRAASSRSSSTLRCVEASLPVAARRRDAA